MKKFCIIIILIITYSLVLANSQFNEIDYAAFYTKDGKHHAQTGVYDNKSLDFSIMKYLLIYSNEKHSVPSFDEKKEEININELNEFLFFEIENGVLSGKCSGFYYNQENDIGYFFKGGFYSNIYIGDITIISYDEELKKYTVLDFNGTFVLRGIISGVDADYKNILFDFEKTFGTRYNLKKYSYIFHNETLILIDYKKYKLGSKILASEKNLKEEIEKYSE